MKRVQIIPKRLFGAVQLTLAGKIEYADLDYSRILRRPLEDILGRSFTDFLPDGEREPALARMKALLASGKAFEARKRYQALNGQPIPVLTNVCLLRDPEGSSTGLVALEQSLSEFAYEG